MATATKLTLDEFLALPETKPGSEYIDGEVVPKPMPNLAHMIIQHLLSMVVGAYLQHHPAGIAGPEGRCVFGPTGQERGPLPDFLFIVGSRLAGADLRGPFRGAPDLAVEVLSPDDRASEVWAKLRFYLEHGVRLVWLIDPDNRTVTVMTTPTEATILFEDDTLDGKDVLPGFSCRVRDILPPSGDA